MGLAGDVSRAVGDSRVAAGLPWFRWALGAVRLALDGLVAAVAVCLLVFSVLSGGLVVAPIALVVIGGLL